MTESLGDSQLVSFRRPFAAFSLSLSSNETLAPRDQPATNQRFMSLGAEVHLLCDAAIAESRVDTLRVAFERIGVRLLAPEVVPTSLAVGKAIRKIAADAARPERTAQTRSCAPSEHPVVVLEFHCCALRREAASLLERLQVPFVGCRSGPLSYDSEDLLMMTCYADGVPKLPYALVDARRTETGLRDVERLTAPLVLLPTDTWGKHRGEHSIVATTASEATAVLSAMLREHPHVMVQEQQQEQSCDVVRVRLFVAAAGRSSEDQLWWAALPEGEGLAMNNEVLQTAAQQLATHVLVHHGMLEAVLTLVVPPAAESASVLRWWLDSVDLQFSLSDPLLHAKVAPDAMNRLLTLLLRDASVKQQRSIPNYVVTFDAATKGYHLRASRSIAKGEIVFEDEGRTFAIVTKPHVRATWSAEDKVTFTRYGWPLDSLGHVYAIWEDHPKRWRPINHSCDPTCVNAAPHSLNTVAARDIREGEDLTMDYATFCDYTMKPFDCHCGASRCRGVIRPDACVLKQYGEHAWHRVHPDENDGSV